MSHGEDSVSDVEVVGEIEATRTGEKQRLAEIYGRELLELVYPGRAPALEMEVPGVSKIPKPKKQPTPRTVPEQPVMGRFANYLKPPPVPAAEPYKDDAPSQSDPV
jgi:hypothetical protein